MVLGLLSAFFRRLPFAIFPLAIGLCCFAASLTPSLIPRDWVLQGALAGVVTALGYMVGRLLQTLWRAIDLPEPRARLLTVLRGLVLLPAVGLLGFCLGMAARWQNSVREVVGMAPVEGVTQLGILGLGFLVFFLLFLLGLIVQKLYNLLRFRLYLFMSPRAAGTLGILILASVFYVGSRDWLVPAVLEFLDNSYEVAQDLFDKAPSPPEDSRIPGSAASLVSWEAMGRPGRNFVVGGPSVQDLSDFNQTPAKKPIRVYVGRSQHEDPKQRAAIALAEMKRLGAFERSVLVVASTTGTGWLDPGAHDTLEYMTNGDVATVAVQYSYLQSPMALVLETRTGLDQARATMQAVYGYWKTLPPDQRPRLYMHGISLGAWSSMYALNVFELINQPIDGALWVGPPFPSSLWNRVVSARNPGTPFVLPQIGKGELIRFSSQYKSPRVEGLKWGPVRIIFLQYASDPIVFFDPKSLWRAPVWMREKLAPDVSPNLVFVPLVTQWQLAMDMMLSKALPQGYGHNYVTRDYIDAWVELLGLEDWSEQKIDALKTLCDLGETLGCVKDQSTRKVSSAEALAKG